MAISNMQQPRQMYGLGSFVKKIGKGIKGAVKSVAKMAKSPLGIAALGLGINQFGIPGIGGSKGFLSNLPGVGSLVQKFGDLNPSAKIGLGSAFATYLGSKGFEQEEVESITRDKDKLSVYLKEYFTKLNPNASDEEVEEFVTTNTSEYATGGRVGFASGTDLKLARDLAAQDNKDYDLLSSSQKNMYNKKASQFIKTMPMAQGGMPTGGRVGLKGGSKKTALGDYEEEDLSYLKDLSPEVQKAFLRRLYIDSMTKQAEGGRIGLEAGANKDFQEYLKGREEFNKKQNAEQLYKEYLENKRRQKVAVEKTMAANGGLMPTGVMRANKAGTIERDYRETGGFVPVGIKEKADDVPAMLSKNEFVMTADAVRGMGGGNIEKGAQRLYDQMKTMEKRVV